MKKFRFLLFVYFVSLTMGVNAFDFFVNNADGKTIYYNIISNYDLTCEVTAYNSSDYWGVINIPSNVNYNSKVYTVTKIGDGTFGSSGLTSITIPNTVTSIGNNAFQNCLGLISVTIPNSVKSIGNRAFSNCKGLTSIIIGNSVMSIESEAFCYCYELKEVTLNSDALVNKDYADSPNFKTIFGNQVLKYIIGNDVKGIGNKAFSGCSGLTSITIGNSVTNIGNSAFSSCSGLTSITIPKSVTNIGNSAFAYCSGLTSITIPNFVTSIGSYAFEDCTGLTSLTIGNSVTSIGNNAFEYCTGLASVTIGNSVTSIGNNAFQNCTSLTSVIIPNSVVSIGFSAFYYCKNLISIEIPNSVLTIGDDAFGYCTSLTSITIPNSITSIGELTFYGCNLTSVVVESGNKYYDSRENCNAIIETASNTLIQGSKTTIIPNSVTGIGRSAFSYCSGLESVDIPIGVTSIGESAFSSCTGLKSVKVHWKRPLSIDGNTFSGVDKSKCALYVPKGTEMLYWVTEGWSSFKNIVEYDEPSDISYYITINGLEGGEIMQKVDIGMTYSYKFKPYEEWEINSVAFNGVDVTSQLQDSIFSTPAIAGNSTLSVVYKKVSSAIDAVEGNDDVRILATSGAIVINGAKAGKAVSVYGLNGNMVESTKTNGASTIVSLPQKGVYIVKVGNDVFKVSI